MVQRTNEPPYQPLERSQTVPLSTRKIDVITSTAFFDAIQDGEAQRVAAMLEEKPDLLRARTDSDVSPVLLAAYHKNENVLAELLDRTSSLDLFEAAATGQTDRVRTLVREQPDCIDEYSPDGFTALGLAAFFGHRETLEDLLSNGAKVNAVSKNAMQVRPIHSAVACRRHEAALSMAESLLANGADVNVAQQGGWTPLHQAAGHGQIELVCLLLNYGADVASKNEEGKTPINLARENEYTEVVNVLRAGESAA